MSVDTQKIIEIVKQVKPLFLDREGSSQIKVKGVADFVTQIDFKVQEQVKTALYELYPEIPVSYTHLIRKWCCYGG